MLHYHCQHLTLLYLLSRDLNDFSSVQRGLVTTLLLHFFVCLERFSEACPCCMAFSTIGELFSENIAHRGLLLPWLGGGLVTILQPQIASLEGGFNDNLIATLFHLSREV